MMHAGGVSRSVTRPSCAQGAVQRFQSSGTHDFGGLVGVNTAT
jgi:hypothetical protein